MLIIWGWNFEFELLLLLFFLGIGGFFVGYLWMWEGFWFSVLKVVVGVNCCMWWVFFFFSNVFCCVVVSGIVFGMLIVEFGCWVCLEILDWF